MDEMKLFSDSSTSMVGPRIGGGAGSYLPPNLVINGGSTSSSSSPDDETAACELRYPRRHSVDTERAQEVLRKRVPSLFQKADVGPLVLITTSKGGEAFRGIRDTLWSIGIGKVCALL